MPVGTGTRSGRPAAPVRCRLEPLEERFLLSGTPIPDLGGNATLDQSQALGTLSTPLTVVGAITNTTANPAEVDWYTFDLAQPATVTLRASAAAGQPAPVVSLYNSDPFDFADPYDPLGNRLVAQATGTASGPSDLSQNLAAGTYYVAVSGAGNLAFNPSLAKSGYPGQTCTYTLGLTEAPLPIQASDGPTVIASDPAAGAKLTRSPLVLRLSLSSALDPNTVQPDQTVWLTYNPTGAFGNANDVDVPLGNVNFTAAADELQLTPASALAPGYYQVRLAGNSSGGQPVVADLNETPLGTDAAHPLGQDFAETFQVIGIDGNVGPNAASDDTAATAQQLGNITGVSLVQVAGTIGDDPAYNFNSPNPNLENPAAQVDLYHFEVTGPGRHQLTAEVFAGRIGSPLDAGLSLFEVDPSTGQLVLVAANDNSLNDAAATNGTSPLFTDPVLYAGLTAGSYYVAVSGTGNVPDPTEGQAVGVNGVFDPNIAYSGTNGFTTGDYVLNLQVGAGAATPPKVVDVSLAQGAQLNGPPGIFTAQFSEPVNLPQLDELAFANSPTLTLNAVYIQGSNGQQYQARLASYDPTTNVGTFLLLQPVPAGPAQLHLSGSGPLGLTDLAGDPIVGDGAPSGDYVVDFTVGGPARGTNGNPLLWQATQPEDTPQAPQVLGILFPDELQSGVVVERTSSRTSSLLAPTNGADYFQFQVLQPRQYFASLTNTVGLPAHALPTLYDASGNIVSGLTLGNGGALLYNLNPGTYVVSVGGWTAAQAVTVQYQLTLKLLGGADSPPALTSGPAPAIRVTYVDSTTETPTTTTTTTTITTETGSTDTAPGNPFPIQGLDPNGKGAAATNPGENASLVLVPVSETIRALDNPSEGANAATTTALLILTQSFDVSTSLSSPVANGLVTVESGPIETGLGLATTSANLLLPRISGSDDPRISEDIPFEKGKISVETVPPSRNSGGTTEGNQPSTPVPEKIVDQGMPPQAPGDSVLPGTVLRVLPGSPALDALFELNPLALRDALSSLGASALNGTAEAGQSPTMVLDQEAAHAWTNWTARVSAGVTLALATWYACSLRQPRLPRKEDLLYLFRE